MKINELSIMTLFNNDFILKNKPIFQPLYRKKNHLTTCKIMQVQFWYLHMVKT